MKDGHMIVGRATVFRTLDLLEKIGYLERVPNGDHWAYTNCNPGEHNHHLTCVSCGKIVSIKECPAKSFINELGKSTGFSISKHHLEILGTCPTCKNN